MRTPCSASAGPSRAAAGPVPSGQVSSRRGRSALRGGDVAVGGATERLQALLGRRSWFGGEGEHEPVTVHWQFHRLVGQLQVADDRMTDTLESGTVVAHVVPGPSEPERVAAGDELTDQVGEPLVVGVLPGVGAQGGSLQEVCKYGMTKDCGLLVNSSRGILYAGTGHDFAEAAAAAAQKLQQEMAQALALVQR